MAFEIFIVDDDHFYGQILKHHLSFNPDYQVTLFENAKSLLSKLYLNPDLIWIDFGLPDMTGEKLIKEIFSKKFSNSSHCNKWTRRNFSSS
jgi:DNA-binding response OmpR family regulator